MSAQTLAVAPKTFLSRADMDSLDIGGAEAVGPTPMDQRQRSRSLGSPRHDRGQGGSDRLHHDRLHSDRCTQTGRLRQVHFAELDECLSSLSISGRTLPPRPHRAPSAGSEREDPFEEEDEEEEVEEEEQEEESDDEDAALPSKKDKRMKLEGAEDVRDSRPASGGRLRGVASADRPFPRTARSCSDIQVDPPSPCVPLPRTTCSSPSPTPNLSPLSVGSLRESSASSPMCGPHSLGPQEATQQASPAEAASARQDSQGGKGSLYQRRGQRSPGQLSLKRCRSVHNRSWTGKREEVLGAEPGTPKLDKCDTL